MKLTNEEMTKIQNKIRKLLALATSSNEAEANSAMRMVAILREKYNITTIDINIEENTANTARVDIAGTSRRVSTWESMLGGSIARAFDCKAIIMGNSNPWQLSIIGTKNDAELVHYYFIKLRRDIVVLADHYAKENKGNGNAKNMKHNYSFGMVTTINKRLKEMNRIRKEVESANTTALVIVKTNAVEKRFTQEHPHTRTRPKPVIRGNRSAWADGMKDGEKLGIHKTLKSENQKMMRA